MMNPNDPPHPAESEIESGGNETDASGYFDRRR